MIGAWKTVSVENNKLFSDSQYGFQANWSTALALLKITEEITSAIESKKYTIGVFIDKKTFDTRNHTMFICKLHTYCATAI